MKTNPTCHFRLSPFVFCLLLSPFAFRLSPCTAQVPQGFNYQAIARDSDGNPITGATIKVKLSVLSDTTGFYAGTGGTYVWEEEHTNVMTNSFGMFTIVLGSPNASFVQGNAASFSTIDWTPANLFVGTKIANPTTYKVMGSAKLWSVPYALRAKDSEQWQTTGSDIYRTTGNLGIGNSTPSFKIDVTGDARITGGLEPNWIELSAHTTGNRYSGIDFHGDDTYTDYSLRIIRSNTGPDAFSRLWHRGLGALQLYTNEAAPIDFYTSGANHRLRIAADGNIGIGTSSPVYKLDVNGEITSRSNNAFRLRNSSYSTILRNDNTNLYLLLTNPGDPDGTWNSLRPLMVSLSTGNTILGNGALTVNHGGNVGIGTTSPTGRMVIQPTSTWDDNTPLFEVKNKYGASVLAVYNNGVRILVEDTDGKGVKGGFAIGGFDPTKAPGAETVNLMMVTPDSVRINIDNNPAKAGLKGGFAIGSFDASKAVNTKAFMNVSPQSSATGQYNTFLGYQAGFKNLNGYNTLIGYRSGYNLVNGNANVFIGMNAGNAFYQGTGNVLLGQDAGLNVTEGERNVYIGHLAGKSASGDANVIVGQQAGENASNPNFNVIIGQFAAKEFSGSPLANVIVGPSAGVDGGGDGNTYIGAEAGSKAGYTDGNVYIGRNAGYYAKGSRNVILGYYAGYGSSASPLTGSNNVFIGYQAGYSETGSNKLYIANSSSNPPLIYGDFSSGRIGLGTITPGHKLDLQQTITNGSVSSFANNGNTNTSHGFRVIAGNASSTGAIFIRFEKGYYGSSTTIGSITHSATSGVAYNTTSDERVKQNIRPTAESLEDLMGIGVYDFNFAGEDTGITQTGFLAQQLFDIYPAAVYKPEKPEELWMVDYSKLTPLLVKSVQEQHQIIEDQQKQIDIQNNKIERLELMIEELQAVVAGNR